MSDALSSAAEGRRVLAGNLRKMRVEATDPVSYRLWLGEESIELNALLGERLALHHTGRIHCVACGSETRRSFNQGYCFACFRSLAQCDRCITSPERCHFHLGTCREPDWALAHCMRPHVVYLANASGVKVGITRASQTPTRWIDQGAVQALPIAHVATRRLSGLVEAVLKRHMSDRTDWRRMLKGDPEPEDLCARRDALLERLGDEIAAAADEHESEPVEPVIDETDRAFRYPVLEYPEKVRSLGFDKDARVEGTLLGIKGQYLILDTGVFNVRRHGGYEIELQLAV
ncbi:MAG: DUF2797 domain-containing protein [Gammaproteobacteria bacterium]|nr:DUF2797 domain-containing protein [Gammaproteobacteria bacterium]